MPAGPTNPPDQPRDPGWHDWPSYRRHVLEECLRLGAPRPDDGVLRIQYLDKRCEMARIAAWAEIHRWEEERARREPGDQPRDREGVRRR